MNNFLQAKIAFAIGLLVLVLTIYPIVNNFKDVGFIFFGSLFSLMRAYYAFAVFLSLSVYFYAVSFLNEKPKILANRLGNISYASAISVPPVYIGIFIIQTTILLLYKIASLISIRVANKVLIESNQQYPILLISSLFTSLIFTIILLSIDKEDELLSEDISINQSQDIDLPESQPLTAPLWRFIALSSFFISLFIPVIIRLFKMMA